MNRSSSLAAGLAAAVLGAAPPAQDPVRVDPAAWLPAETLFLVDLVDAPGLLNALGRSLGPVPRGLPGRVRAAPALVALGLRAATGYSLGELLDALGSREVALALLDGSPPTPVLVSRVTDRKAARKVLSRLEGGVVFGLRGDLLGMAPAQGAVDDLWREDRPRLADVAGFAERRPELLPGRSVRFYVNLARLRRRLGVRAGGLFERMDAGGRFLVGPIVAAVEAASRLDGTIRFDPGGVRLKARLNGSPHAAAPAVATLLSKRPRAVPPLPEEGLATIALDRDLHAFFARAESLLAEDDLTGLKSFLSIADTLIGRASFVDDLLARLEGPLTLLIVAEPPLAPPRPRIALPSFVLAAPLTDPRAIRSIESLAANLALIHVQQRRRAGKRPFLLRKRELDGHDALVAVPAEEDGPGDPPLEQALSPTLLFAHGHVLLASTTHGARAVARALARGSRRVEGDLVEARGAAVADYVARNRNVLAIGNVLDTGKRWLEAVEETKILEGLARAVRDARLAVRLRPSVTEVELVARRARP